MVELCRDYLNGDISKKTMCDVVRNRLNEFREAAKFDVTKLNDDKAFTLFSTLVILGDIR